MERGRLRKYVKITPYKAQLKNGALRQKNVIAVKRKFKRKKNENYVHSHINAGMGWYALWAWAKLE